jgi:uncharacterized protein YbjT (DUF2867 family)
MKAHAPMLRMIWAVFGVTAVVILALTTAADVLIFVLAFGSKAGSYSGQASDRHLAWTLLIGLAAGWVVVLAGMIWPALRWKRRGMLSAADRA